MSSLLHDVTDLKLFLHVVNKMLICSYCLKTYEDEEARRDTGEYLLSARDENTMQLSRNRNGNAPLGMRGTAR